MILKAFMRTAKTIQLKILASLLLKRWEYDLEVQRRFQIAVDELRLGKVQSLRAFAKQHGLA
jgi:hypothetical protein